MFETGLKYLQVWKFYVRGGNLKNFSKKIITLLRGLKGKISFEDLRADLGNNNLEIVSIKW